MKRNWWQITVVALSAAGLGLGARRRRRANGPLRPASLPWWTLTATTKMTQPDPDIIETEVKKLRGEFWGQVVASIISAAVLAFIVGMVRAIVLSPGEPGGLADVIDASLRWPYWSGSVTVGIAVALGLLGLVAHLNTAIAAMNREDPVAPLRDAVSAHRWYSDAYLLAAGAAVVGLAISILGFDTMSQDSPLGAGTVVLLNLGAIVMAASVKRRARSVIEETRSEGWDRKTRANIGERAASFGVDLTSVAPAWIYSAPSLLRLLKRACVVAIGVTVLFAVTFFPMGPPTDRTFWSMMLLFLGGFVLINFCVLLLTVASWAQPNRKVRWYGISFVGFCLRVVAIVVSVMAAVLGSFAGPEYRPFLVVPFILLAAAPTWVILGLTNPLRHRRCGRLLAWLGTDVWGLVPPELAQQQRRIDAREPQRKQVDSRPTVGAAR